MDRDPARPLTPAEAKARLREAALRVSPQHWISEHPLGTLAAALVGGFLAGRQGTTAVARTFLMRRLMPVVLTMLLSRLRRR